jgi:hypothetical protein
MLIKEDIPNISELIESYNRDKLETTRIKLYAALAGQPIMEEEEIKITPDNSWMDIVQFSKNISMPVISNNSLGNEVLDAALDKKVKELQGVLGISSDEIRAKLISELKSDFVAKKSAISTARFLRDFGFDFFLECPECSFINEPDWDICTSCGFAN